MLGRLRMGIEECETTFCDFSQAIFTKKKSALNPTRVKDYLQANGTFDEAPLEDLVKEKIKKAGLLEAELLRDDRPDACKVFVSVVRSEDNSPTVLRSYHSGKLLNRLYNKCKIWEAARATSAASTFFEPIRIGETKFVDGGLRNNNPIHLIRQEARNLWPDDDLLIVSIGTGDAPGGSYEGSLKDIVERLKEIATDTERTNQIFFTEHTDMARQRRLFRFTVPGLASIGLDESKEKATIIARTESYIESYNTMIASVDCVASLSLKSSSDSDQGV